MSSGCKFIALGYNVPINPSKGRVYVWRKLKEYGAEYFKQGVAVLPNSPSSLAQFRTLSGRIREMGGDASIVELSFIDRSDEEEMIARFRAQVETEYEALLADCSAALDKLRGGIGPTVERGVEDVRKMMRRYGKVKSRGDFASDMAQELEQGFAQIVDSLRETAADFSIQLKKALDKDAD